MRLLPVVAGAIVPHAPLLLPELDSDEIAKEAADLRAAIAELDLNGAEAVIVLSPHGLDPGIYRTVRGDLNEFGAAHLGADFPAGDGMRDRLTRALDLPAIDGDVDYGVLVPAMLADWTVPIVGIALGDDPGPLGGKLAGSDLPPIAVVGSAHGSAALSPRAPLTLRQEARDLEAAFLHALQRDVSEAAGLAPALAGAGSCGAAVFRIFGELFPGRPARLSAYRAPVGVGYMVAEIE